MSTVQRKRLAAMRQLREEMDALMAERRHLMARQAALKAGRPRPGREDIVKAAIKRYGVEIAEINRQVGLLEANLEGLA